MYDTSIMMSLANNITNICSEISKIREIVGVTYTCDVKGLKELEKMGRK